MSGVVRGTGPEGKTGARAQLPLESVVHLYWILRDTYYVPCTIIGTQSEG